MIASWQKILVRTILIPHLDSPPTVSFQKKSSMIASWKKILVRTILIPYLDSSEHFIIYTGSRFHRKEKCEEKMQK